MNMTPRHESDASSSPDWPLWFCAAALGLAIGAWGLFAVLALPLEVFGPLHPFIDGVVFHIALLWWGALLGLGLAWLADTWKRRPRQPLRSQALAPWRGFMLFALLLAAGGTTGVAILFAATLIAAAVMTLIAAGLARRGIFCPQESGVALSGREEGVSFADWRRVHGRGLARQLALGVVAGATVRGVAALFAPDVATAYAMAFGGGFSGLVVALLLGMALPFPQRSTAALAPLAADLLWHGQEAAALAFLLGAGVLALRRLRVFRKEAGSLRAILPWTAAMTVVSLGVSWSLASLLAPS